MAYPSVRSSKPCGSSHRAVRVALASAFSGVAAPLRLLCASKSCCSLCYPSREEETLPAVAAQKRAGPLGDSYESGPAASPLCSMERRRSVTDADVKTRSKLTSASTVDTPTST